MNKIINPILKGFNPDPSICRVGDDYYIATSTFEWFPGVQIHHSKDLISWELISHPLTRISQLDMFGTPNSTGIWAPCLSYDQGIFYLIYTNVRNLQRYKDAPNYLVTTTNIKGEWSDPIFMNRSGFDPSLFHDSDGRKWFVNLKWETLYGRNPFGGILLQEYDPIAEKLVGPVKNIFRGSELGLVEGPHLYKKDDYYYLLVAEGGTGYKHGATLARSKSIDGPYDIHPQISVVTGDTTKLHTTLQKAGHASIVNTPNDEWYLVHLCSRPLPNSDRCNLGRETAIQKVIWKEDDWLYLEDGGKTPYSEVTPPMISDSLKKDIQEQNRDTATSPFIDYFIEDTLNIHWNTLRIPASERLLSLNANQKGIRLYGRESLESTFEQSLIARRQQSFKYEAETKLIFKPETSLHMAGLTAYYNTNNYYYLRMTYDEDAKLYCLGVLANLNGDPTMSMMQDDNIFFDSLESVQLKVVINNACLQFHYAVTDSDFIKIGPEYDASTLSDDFSYLKHHSFTGSYIGICCQDSAYGGHPADFEYFTYTEAE